ncbi:hypothetical protein AAC387_Pa09g2188 [Persea americana]
MSATESESQEGVGEELDSRNCYLQEFSLHETRSMLYIIGRYQNGKGLRVLKIDRLDPDNLNISEDNVTYSQPECDDLLIRIDEGNKATGGLKFISTFYGIVGFIKFLGPYYMLVITKRREIGAICGHKVYAIDKIELISIQSNVVNSKDESRYEKLLCTLDLTKDFFFSYSYNIMRSLQKNLCENVTEQVSYETMFVWNEFLTREIRNHLKNTLWTIALVYGYFEQCKLSISGKDFQFTLIARRSRHYAGTRFLKRGINEKGRVANEVETEQIVFEDVSDGAYPAQITSIVQTRGSIPLFWSQDLTSRLNKPDIILLEKDTDYQATRLHFANLVKRYGNPIIIWNLIKACEEKPRESILLAEYANAIEVINKDQPPENQLKFLHWDLSTHHKISNAAEVFPLMDKVAMYAVNFTGFLYCKVAPELKLNEALRAMSCGKDLASTGCTRDNDIPESEIQEDTAETFKFQKGVLRTNCIDCLDRTNVAQCAYGWAALLCQLHALGFIDAPREDPNGPLANELTRIYERMGDSLSLQYGGSPAQNKLFCERRGEWKATIMSQRVFRTIQRYCSNACFDAQKQNAINLFLGYFQPQQGKPALWELDSDQHCNVGRSAQKRASIFKRSLSDGQILHESNTPRLGASPGQTIFRSTAFADGRLQEGANRYTFSRTHQQLSNEVQRQVSFGSDSSYHGLGDSNFLDMGWLTSSGNSIDDETHVGSSSFSNSTNLSQSSENNINHINDVPPLTSQHIQLEWKCTEFVSTLCSVLALLKTVRFVYFSLFQVEC